MKLYCDVCNMHKEFEVKSEPYKAKVKGVEINTVIKVSYCKTCGNEIYNRELEIENDIIVFDEYKKNVGLLTSKEIKDIRKKYHLSQATFAKVLGFGEKTITRYENGAIQDESIDNLMMLAKNELNFHKLWEKSKNNLKQSENNKIKEFFDMFMNDVFMNERVIYKTKKTISKEGLSYTYSTKIEEEKYGKEEQNSIN